MRLGQECWVLACAAGTGGQYNYGIIAPCPPHYPLSTPAPAPAILHTLLIISHPTIERERAISVVDCRYKILFYLYLFNLTIFTYIA